MPNVADHVVIAVLGYLTSLLTNHKSPVQAPTICIWPQTMASYWGTLLKIIGLVLV